MKSLVLLIVFLWPVGEIYAASLPVREVVRRFLQTSPLLEAIHKEQLAAEAVEQESSRRFFPSISLNTGVTDQKTPSVLQGGFDFAPKKIYSTTLDFEQPLYLGGRIWRGWELRELSAELAKWKTIEVEQKALLEILGVALQLNVSQNMEKIFKQSESTQAEFLRITQKRYRRGASKSYEVAQAEADLLSYRGRLQEVRLQKESFSQKLQTQLDLNDSAEPLSVDFGSSQKPEVPRQISLEEVQSRRPEYQMSEVQRRMAVAQKWLDLGEHLPSLSLMGSVGYQNPDREDLVTTTSEMHRVTLNLSIPLFSGLSSLYVRRAAEHRIAAAELERLRWQRDLKVEVFEARQRLTTAWERFEGDRQWAEKAKLAHTLGLKNYRLGVISSFQVVQLQKSHEAAALSFWSSWRELYLAKMAWAVARGQRLSELFVKN